MSGPFLLPGESVCLDFPFPALRDTCPLTSKYHILRIMDLEQILSWHSDIASQQLARRISATDEGNQDGDDSNTDMGVATKTRAKTKKPSPYKVLLLNDDYTPMEFVVLVLKRFFNMDIDEATRVMLHVHQKGVGVCGMFSYEVAETKVTQVMDFARKNEHPLQCTLEKA